MKSKNSQTIPTWMSLDSYKLFHQTIPFYSSNIWRFSPTAFRFSFCSPTAPLPGLPVSLFQNLVAQKLFCRRMTRAVYKSIIDGAKKRCRIRGWSWAHYLKRQEAAILCCVCMPYDLQQTPQRWAEEKKKKYISFIPTFTLITKRQIDSPLV